MPSQVQHLYFRSETNTSRVQVHMGIVSVSEPCLYSSAHCIVGPVATALDAYFPVLIPRVLCCCAAVLLC